MSRIACRRTEAVFNIMSSCRGTWRQGVPHAQQRCGFNDVDRAARAAAQVLHGC